MHRDPHVADLDRELRTAAAARATCRQLDAELRAVAVELQRLHGDEAAVQRHAALAASELQRRDGWFTRWFRAPTGDRRAHEEQIAEARAEQHALDARVAQLQAEQRELQQRHAVSLPAAERYADASAAKAAALRASSPEANARLQQLDDEVADAHAGAKRQGTLLERVRNAEASLLAAREQLNGPHIAIGGGFGGEAIAHGQRRASLDVAVAYLQRAQQQLLDVVDDEYCGADLAATLERDASASLAAHGSAITGTRQQQLRSQVVEMLENVRAAALVLERHVRDASAAVLSGVAERESWIEAAGAANDA